MTVAMDPSGGSVLEMARLARSQHQQAFEGVAGDVVRLPEGATKELVDALSRVVTRSVRQIVPFTSFRTRDEFAYRVWRGVAADRGIDVRRLYVIPPGGDPDQSVDRQIKADEEAGVRSRMLELSTSPASGWRPADISLSDVWLIDGCAVVRREYSEQAPPVWVVSTRVCDIRTAAELWHRLEDPELLHPRLAGDLDLTEPLLESARMIHTMAPMSCTRDHVDRTSCAWYHGIWQYLRLFDMVSSPSWHANFYQRQLVECLAGEGPRRVLITGAADYSVLAYVIAAAKASGKLDPEMLEVHVMDLCPTPLNACRWYADRLGLDVHLHETDILNDASSLLTQICGDDAAERKFDVIVTDAFLTRFSRDEAEHVVDNWRVLLRPGGRVVTTVRLHPLEARRSGDDRSGLAQDMLRYTLRLRKRALGWRSSIGIELDELVGAARAYTLKITSTDMGDADAVVNLVRRHGFDVCGGAGGGIETGGVDGELAPARYARLVLTAT